MDDIDGSGWGSLGELLGGGTQQAQVRGIQQGLTLQGLAANAGLHAAQTQQSLAQAREDQAQAIARENQSAALWRIQGLPNATFNDPALVPIGDLIAAGAGANYASAQEGRQHAQSQLGDELTQHYKSILGDPTQIGKPTQTAAAQYISGKLDEPYAVPMDYAVHAGTPLPVVHETPTGEALVGQRQASANSNNANAAQSSDENSAWSPEAIHMAGERYRLTGQLPATGRGAQGAAIRGKIATAAAESAATNGDTASAAAYRQIANKSNSGALTQLTKQQAMVGSFERTALANMELAEGALGKVDLTGSPILNKAIVAWKQGVSGDPDTSAYVNALTTAKNEYAKVLSGATGSTGITDAARREADDLFAKISSPAQIHAVFGIARQEMANRMVAFQQQQAELHDSIMGGSAPAVHAPVPAPGGGPTRVSSDADWAALPPGALFVGPDGQTRRK